MSERARLQDWFTSLFTKANSNPKVEIELKFSAPFQGIVSSSSSDFIIGVDYQCFRQVMSHLGYSCMFFFFKTEFFEVR